VRCRSGSSAMFTFWSMRSNVRLATVVLCIVNLTFLVFYHLAGACSPPFCTVLCAYLFCDRRPWPSL
jgi:hypothetical protein